MEPHDTPWVTEPSPSANRAGVPTADDALSWIAWADELGVSRHLGIRCIDLGPDSAAFLMERPPLLNSRGWVHGASLLGAFDQCGGITLMWASRGRAKASTANLAARFLRPAQAPVSLDGVVVREGRTLAFVEVRAAGADGRPCARADITFVIGDPKWCD